MFLRQKSRLSAESTRVKDLVDILLIATHMPVAAVALRAALQVTFVVQGTAAPPSSLPAPPAAWMSKYQRLAQDVGLDDTVLPVALEHARQFLDSVLSGQTTGTCSPIAHAWL